MLCRFSTLIEAAACGLAAALLSCASATAAGYQVVRPADGFTSIASVELNNSGAVVFVGKKGAGPGQLSGIYKSGSGGFLTLHEVMSFEAPPGEEVIVPGGVAINGSNEVLAYGGVLGTRFSRLGVGSGSINWFSGANSLAAFPFGFDYNDRKLILWGRFVFGGEAQEQQARSCDNCSGIELNNRNQMLTFFPVGGAYQFALVDLGLIVPDPRFPESKRWAPVRTNGIATLARPRPATMNENGDVAFYNAQPDGTVGIYKSAGGAITAVVESRAGDTQFEFHTFQSFAINNRGEVAFTASSRTLKTSGVFRGSNPLLHRIVAAGDLLDGVPIPAYLPGFVSNEGPTAGRWFNDNGQVVVGGGNNLWVTGDVPRGPGLPPQQPESAVFRYVATATSPGNYGAVASWERVSPQPPIPEPPRVPETTTNRSDTILYDRSETYTVDVGARRAHRLIVENGDVAFLSGSIKVDAVSFDEPSALIDNARLNLLTAFSLTNNHAWIGPTAASRVDVGFGGNWVTLGSLRVGGVGEGILNVNPGGTVVSAESRIGTGVGGGKATVTTNATWTTGNLAIGMGGAGELTVTGNGQVTSEVAVIGDGHVQIDQGGRWETDHLALGSGGGQGAISIFDDGRVNSASVVIGLEPGGLNTITVEGIGGGAPVFEAGVTEVGRGGSGHLQVFNGGRVLLGQLHVATSPEVSGKVLVAGGESETELETGSLLIGESGQGELRIEDGGIVRVAAAGGRAIVGGPNGGLGTLLVSGTHPVTGTPSSLIVENLGFDLFWVGYDSGMGQVRIEQGGRLELQGDGGIMSSHVGAPSLVTVDGVNSVFHSDGILAVGQGPNPGGAILALVFGRVEASSIDVNRNGRVVGVGTLAVPPSGRVTNYNGTIAPGLSPGVLTIEGSYGQGPEGRLLIEIGGTNSSAYDQLVVTNEATLDGQVTFKFLNGFAPKAGQQFKFLNVGGARSGAFTEVALQNLSPGFQFNIAPSGSALSMTALNDGVYDTSLPGRVDVAITNVGGISYATYTLTTSNTCHAIELDGALVHSNNTFRQGFQGTRLIQAECLAEEISQTGALVLGALGPGDYSFAVMVDGQTVQTIAFTVSGDESKTLLNPTRLPNGGVQFEINGLPAIPYRIDVSTDLETWSPLTSGQLPAAFTDFDAAIFPTRFYRAVIGP